LLIVAVPNVVLPSANVTVPVDVAGVRLAVNVTPASKADGFVDEVSNVLAWLTTFSEAEPLTAPAVAVSVAAPAVCAAAKPALPGEFLIDATGGFDEFQVTD
jgi:hypothetical protein